MHAPGAVLVVRREDVDGVAAHAERAAEEVALRALVLQRDEVGDELALVDLAALLEREGHRRIGLDRADTVDAGHRGDDDHVVALEQRARRRMAHAVDLLVDRAFLLDIGVGARDVGFRLVVVVIGNEILHRVVGKERLELAVELRGERLVGREDERGPLRRLDHLGHGEGLARAGDAEQHLRAVVALHAFHQVLDRLRLIALRFEVGGDGEPHAAFGFFRPRRAVRRPHLGVAAGTGEFRPPLAQQPVERLLAGQPSEAALLRRQVGARQAVFSLFLHLPLEGGGRSRGARSGGGELLGVAAHPTPPAFGGRPSPSRGGLQIVGVVGQSQFSREPRIDADHRRRFVGPLRRLAETLARPARGVGGGEILPPLPGGVGRRL